MLGRTSESLKVQLPDGSQILGRYLNSDSGKGIRGFLGVPYAEPPVGDLRFKVSDRFCERVKKNFIDTAINAYHLMSTIFFKLQNIFR